MNIYKQLNAPFDASDIEWRVQASGVGSRTWARVLAYVDARAIMNRLDLVFGPYGWQDSYEHLKDGVLCTISVWDDQGRLISKQDGAPETDIEAFKGGISKSFVRCAVKWGIGRYLYELGEVYANCVDQAYYNSLKDQQKTKYKYQKDRKTNTVFYWKIPDLPKEMLSERDSVKHELKELIVKIGPQDSLDALNTKTFDDLFALDTKELTDALVELSGLLNERKAKVSQPKAN